MCGFAGFIDFNGSSSKEVLLAMTDPITHRGPDDSGHELITASDARVGLGFRRLSILDLSYAGHQPMINPENGDHIIFNGEVYNFREIRKELDMDEEKFHSTGDTEVILRAYQKWGRDCVRKFIGMFAIVIYSKQENKVVLFRDRAGVKPLFYYWSDGLFLFGSELKAFHGHHGFKKSVNQDALAYFFRHGYVSSPHTIFENTFQVEPGAWLEINLHDRKLTTERYWDAFSLYNRPVLNVSYEEALSKTEELMISAFNYRMISDVPVGIFLSGGYDSSAVAAILQKTNAGKIKTYTIGFQEEGYNEAPHARKVAEFLGTEHHEYYCSFSDAMDIIPRLPEIYDQPFGDSSAVPTTLISTIARKHVKVALSADGGDELFAGYTRHLKGIRYISRINGIPPGLRRLLALLIPSNHQSLLRPDRKGKLKEVFHADHESEMFDIINQTYTGSELKKLLKYPFKEIENPFRRGNSLPDSVEVLNKILAVDYGTYLTDDILQKVDRASMSVSLEAREPFLDHRLLEYLSVLPSSYKIHDGIQKRMLKDIVHRYIPKELMERPKMGFGIPLENWFREDLLDLFMDYMSDDAVKHSEFLNPSAVIPMRDNYLKGQFENFDRLWFIFVFQMWSRGWL